MNRNDDAAERAARRKSAHFAATAADKENTASPRGAKAAAAGSSANAERRRKRLSAVAPVAMPVSMEVMNTNFEEWMKLATDNKITATNTWNFALIDYFHDLTLLRNGPDDQSINFQKASCTLDGCVKIWTSRVDSVATETGKLLSGLAGGNAGDEEDGENGEEDEDGAPKATRKTHRSEATLAKSFAALQVKKFDLEFTVDPLFKKTKEDFDEGGAGGLLMNHLGIDGTGRVVFDAGDAVVEEEEEEEEMDMEDTMVDVSALREFIPTAERAAGLSISETLGSFRFSSNPDDMPDLATITGLNSFNDNDEERDESPEPMGGEVHDFFGDEDYDMGGPAFDDNDYGGDDAPEDAEDVLGEGSGPAAGGAAVGPGGPGPARGGQELFMAFADGNDDGGMYDYFDRGFAKGWAGAEHWKLRKVAKKDLVAAATTREKKEKKAAFTIDFTSDEGAQSTKELFKAGGHATITMPKRRKSRRDEYLLPEDMHFSSRQLLRLFLKPKLALRRRARSPTDDGEIDENFWAAAAAAGAEADEGGMGEDGAPVPFESQFFHDDGFIDDGEDDAFIDDNLLPEGEEEDLRAVGGEMLRRARPENVHYAKKAKRVDVKRLKDDIWADLRSLVEEGGGVSLGGGVEEGVPPLEPDLGESEAEKDKDNDEPQTPPVKTFDTVIQSLRSSYPREKMSEISTSFCFICLLHLANEEGLSIEAARTDGNEGLDVGLRGYADPDGEPAGKAEIEKDDKIVGELQALKVFKDPTAGRAA